jgi:hypothetical protein
MENSINMVTDTLYMASSGLVYRITEDFMVVNQKRPVEISYPAFLKLSCKECQVGIDTLLSPNAISGGEGYTSRNICVVHIPGLGMAWATRVSTKLPLAIAQKYNVDSCNIGGDFLFLWPPGKALSAYLTVLEQTRLDNRARFLCTCDPTPAALFTDWDSVVPYASELVDQNTLSVGQRIFAASFKPMVHLASPRYTMDVYCIHRSKEDSFLHKNAPIQLKFSGLKRLRNGQKEFEGTRDEAREKALDFFLGDSDEEAAPTRRLNVPRISCKDATGVTTDENTSPVAKELKGLFFEQASGVAKRTSPGSRPLSPLSPRNNTSWDTSVSFDAQCCIIEAVVHQALNDLDERETLATIRNTRLVCKGFCERTDHSIHSVLIDAYSKAKRFCAPTIGVQRLDGLLLTRSWWDHCRLPYMGLLTYNTDDARAASPRTALATLTSIVQQNNHKPYPRCSVVPNVDTTNTKRQATMAYIQKKVRDLRIYNAGFKASF